MPVTAHARTARPAFSAPVSAATPPATTSPSSLRLPALTAALRSAGCVFAQEEAALLLAEAATAADLATMLKRRVHGLPLEQILGWAEFCGLRIIVEPGVFVPRRRTEFLARQAISFLRDGVVRTRLADGLSPVVVDLCCGAGAVGAAIYAAVPQIELHATDIDVTATRCAARNLPASVHLYTGDLFTPLPRSLRGRVDVLVANVPYVPTPRIDTLPAEARLHEPRRALDGGIDGLDVLRQVSAAAVGWLTPDGALLIEVSDSQVARAQALFALYGLDASLACSADGAAGVVVGSRSFGSSRADGVETNWPSARSTSKIEPSLVTERRTSLTVEL